MLGRSRHYWQSRGHYRRLFSDLDTRDRLAWALHVARSVLFRSGTQRPDAHAIHSRPSFVSVHSRPKIPRPRSFAPARTNNAQTAIVMQGPLVRDSDFTLETVAFYRQSFPETPLVIAVWETEAPEDIERLASLGAHVMSSPMPRDPGPANINLQRESVTAGLLVAQELGCEFALRTRSDQRMYSGEAITYLHAVLGAFRAPRDGNSGRIVATSLDTFRYRLYGLSDQLHFGRTVDLLSFWRRPEEPSYAAVIENERAQTAHRLQIPEVTLTSQYLACTGWALQWTLTDWWEVLADRFVIIDSSSLDLFWPKYTRSEYRWRRYGSPSPLEELDFADWLSLYAFPEGNQGLAMDHLLDRDDWWDSTS